MDTENKYLTYEKFTKILKNICHNIISHKDYLNELDSATGDGDLGITVDRGFQAIEKVLDVDHNNIGQLLIKSGMEFNNSAGSTMGALFGMALMRAGKRVGDINKLDLSDYYQLISCAEESIREKGKSQVGDKTMLDALAPACNSIKDSLENQDSTEDALRKAYLAAEDGSEKTKTMKASSGRSRWLGERTIGHPDPGAVFISLIMKTIYENYKNEK